MLIKWWLLLESNQRHQDFQSCALPTELRSHKLVARGRFELPHARVKVVCLTAWLPGNNGGADGSRTRVQKIFTNHKSHSYLTSFGYSVRSASLYQISISRVGSNVEVVHTRVH